MRHFPWILTLLFLVSCSSKTDKTEKSESERSTQPKIEVAKITNDLTPKDFEAFTAICDCYSSEHEKLGINYTSALEEVINDLPEEYRDANIESVILIMQNVIDGRYDAKKTKPCFQKINPKYQLDLTQKCLFDAGQTNENVQNIIDYLDVIMPQTDSTNRQEVLASYRNSMERFKIIETIGSTCWIQPFIIYGMRQVHQNEISWMKYQTNAVDSISEPVYDPLPPESKIDYIPPPEPMPVPEEITDTL